MAKIFKEVEIYRHTIDISSYDRAWCVLNATKIYNGTAEQFSDTGLVENTTYYYKIITVMEDAFGNLSYSNGTNAKAGTKYIEEMSRFFLATSGASISSALAAEGTDISSMTAENVVSLLSSNYNIIKENDVWKLKNKNTVLSYNLTEDSNKKNTVKQALFGNLAFEILQGIYGEKTLIGNKLSLADWMKLHVEIIGDGYKLDGVTASVADVYNACPDYLRDLFLQYVNAFKQAVSDAQSAASDLGVEQNTTSALYQQWDGYPFSNVLTSNYPYQSVYRLTNNVIYLMVSNKPMYYESGKIRKLYDSSSYMIPYDVSTSQWGNILTWSSLSGTVMQSNNDIYTDSSLSAISFYKTTVDPEPWQYTLANAVSATPDISAGTIVSEQSGSVVGQLPVVEDGENPPYVPLYVERVSSGNIVPKTALNINS